jgi:hypothetical protein
MTRTEVQAIRIRVAAALRNLSIAELHEAVLNTDGDYTVSYEKIRRAYSGERVNELFFSDLKAIATATDAPLEYIAGDDDVPFPDLHMGVYLSSVCEAPA